MNSNTVANTIRMTRSFHKGSFLIVEGETDARFYKQFLNNEKCRVIVGYGKEQCIKALKIIDETTIKGVLAIVDADFWVLEKHILESENLFLTDTHDIETMIIRSKALEKILYEFASEELLRKFSYRTKKNIREKLLECGLVIGYLKLISSEKGLGLKFKDLIFEKFIDKKDLTVVFPKLIKHLKRNSREVFVLTETLKEEIKVLEAKNLDVWHVCNGHDLVDILLVGLKRIFGERNARKLDSGSLQGDLRLAYPSNDFKETKLFSSLKNWEKDNFGFLVLNDN
ncbi:DUF4435 domain-containing protein [bacterium]|nr:DUF4435 domain-containing protein [bacterium]